jgi:hypothetical protein
MENQERKFRTVFGHLKADDLRHTPRFQTMRQEAARRSSSTPTWFVAFRVPLGALGVVAAVGGLVMAVHLHRLSMARELQEWTALSNWHATTDELLSITHAPADSLQPAVHSPTDQRQTR